MDRHPTDFVRLLFGLAFLAVGAGFIVHEATDSAVDPEWIATIAFVAIGFAFLAATLVHRPRRAAVAVDVTSVPANGIDGPIDGALDG